MAKVWKDYPNTTTPITAAALNDLERRVDTAVTNSRKVEPLLNTMEEVKRDLATVTRESATSARKLGLTVAAPSSQKVHRAIPHGTTPVIKGLFHAGSTNQHGQIVVPVTGADLDGWHTAVATNTNLSGNHYNVVAAITGTHETGPVLTFTDGYGNRVANQGIGVTLIVIGWKA